MISASYVSACLDVGRGEVIRYLASGISSHPARGLPPPHDTITSYWAPTTCGSQIVVPPKSKKMRVKSVSLKQQSLTTYGYIKCSHPKKFSQNERPFQFQRCSGHDLPSVIFLFDSPLSPPWDVYQGESVGKIYRRPETVETLSRCECHVYYRR